MKLMFKHIPDNIIVDVSGIFILKQTKSKLFFIRQLTKFTGHVLSNIVFSYDCFSVQPRRGSLVYVLCIQLCTSHIIVVHLLWWYSIALTFLCWDGIRLCSPWTPLHSIDLFWSRECTSWCVYTLHTLFRFQWNNHYCLFNVIAFHPTVLIL